MASSWRDPPASAAAYEDAATRDARLCAERRAREQQCVAPAARHGAGRWRGALMPGWISVVGHRERTELLRQQEQWRREAVARAAETAEMAAHERAQTAAVLADVEVCPPRLLRGQTPMTHRPARQQQRDMADIDLMALVQHAE